MGLQPQPPALTKTLVITVRPKEMGIALTKLVTTENRNRDPAAPSPITREVILSLSKQN